MYQLAVLLHLLAAIVWIGGTLFLLLVIVPLTRSGAIPRPQAWGTNRRIFSGLERVVPAKRTPRGDRTASSP